MSKRKLVLANNPLLSGPGLGERDRSGVPYREIEISQIERDPKQPRRSFDEDKLAELSDSIKRYGVLSPILVRSHTPGRYQLISGERRLRATQIAGLKSIPAILDQREDKDADTTLAIQLVENLQRADLSPLERSQAIGMLRDTYSLSVRDIAAKLGISKSMVQRSLEILELPADLLNALKEGASESKVLLLSKIEDAEIRASYLRDLDSLTRNQIQKDVSGSKTKKLAFTIAEDERICGEIQNSVGAKVRISRQSPDSEAGRLIVDFYSSDDLKELFRKLVA